MEHFTNDQDDRYDAFRRGRLSLPILKRVRLYHHHYYLQPPLPFLLDVIHNSI